MGRSDGPMCWWSVNDRGWTMVAEIRRRRTVGERVQLDVEHGPGQYTGWIVPVKGMSDEVVGDRVWIGNATLLL